MKIKNINFKQLNNNFKVQKNSFKKILIYTLTFTLSMSGCSIQKRDIEQTQPTTTKLEVEVTTEIPTIEIETTTQYQEDYIEPTASVYPDHYVEPTTEKETTTQETTEILTTETTTQEPTTEIPTTEIETTTQEIIEPETTITQVNEKKLVALTFDDGPSKYTSELVKVLQENNATATFFLVGRSIKHYSNSVKEAYLAGNEIAVHTYTHTSFKKMTIDEIVDEINRTRALIEGIDVEWSDLVRPPYGSITSEIVQSIDTSFILWNVDTRDWESRDKEAIKKEVEKAIKEGAIILFHDTYASTIEAIKEILPLYSDEYEFVSVTELFERNQKKLEDNKKYYSLTK